MYEYVKYCSLCSNKVTAGDKRLARVGNVKEGKWSNGNVEIVALQSSVACPPQSLEGRIAT